MGKGSGEIAHNAPIAPAIERHILILELVSRTASSPGEMQVGW
jgi:hypothetical protein